MDVSNGKKKGKKKEEGERERERNRKRGHRDGESNLRSIIWRKISSEVNREREKVDENVGRRKYILALKYSIRKKKIYKVEKEEKE